MRRVAVPAAAAGLVPAIVLGAAEAACECVRLTLTFGDGLQCRAANLSRGALYQFVKIICHHIQCRAARCTMPAVDV